jgi:Flp pilus assembly protein TadD
MKICPFVSHMLGDDNSDSWTIDDGNIKKSKATKEDKPKANVVILGYEDNESRMQTDTMTEVVTETAEETTVPSHLHCLTEFDLVFSMLENKQDNPPEHDSKEIAHEVGVEVSKGIDKIWKFQTKSVEELIKSLGETEKTQAKSTTILKKDLEKSLDMLAAKLDKSGAGDLKKSISELKKRIDEREQGFEDLSGTMSELVLNLHESITKIEGKSEDTLAKIKKLSDSTLKKAAIKDVVEDSMERRMKDLDPVNVSLPLDGLRKQLEDVLENQRQDNPAWEEKLDDLHNQLEDVLENQKQDNPAWEDRLNALHKKLEEATENHKQDTPDYEEKLEATLRAQHQLETKAEAWHEEISERIQDLRTQQKTWEEQIKKLVAHHDEVLEALEDVRKQQDNEHGRAGQKEAKKLNNLGVTSFHNGAYDMARDQFVQAVHLDPDFAEAHNNLGLAYTELDEEDHASEAFSRAIELNPELHAAYNNLGYIHFKRGDYDQAIEMYNEALGRSTHNSSAYTNLGNAHFKLGRTEDAKQAWTKALEIDPGNEKAKRNLDRIDEDAN